eukprot:30928-Pelagococcus_subviridis.AAC.1
MYKTRLELGLIRSAVSSPAPVISSASTTPAPAPAAVPTAAAIVVSPAAAVPPPSSIRAAAVSAAAASSVSAAAAASVSAAAVVVLLLARRRDAHLQLLSLELVPVVKSRRGLRGHGIVVRDQRLVLRSAALVLVNFHRVRPLVGETKLLPHARDDPDPAEQLLEVVLLDLGRVEALDEDAVRRVVQAVVEPPRGRFLFRVLQLFALGLVALFARLAPGEVAVPARVAVPVAAGDNLGGLGVPEPAAAAAAAAAVAVPASAAAAASPAGGVAVRVPTRRAS